MEDFKYLKQLAELDNSRRPRIIIDVFDRSFLQFAEANNYSKDDMLEFEGSITDIRCRWGQINIYIINLNSISKCKWIRKV